MSPNDSDVASAGEDNSEKTGNWMGMEEWEEVGGVGGSKWGEIWGEMAERVVLKPMAGRIVYDRFRGWGFGQGA